VRGKSPLSNIVVAIMERVRFGTLCQFLLEMLPCAEPWGEVPPIATLRKPRGARENQKNRFFF
jgi:hypothetical protein